MAGDTEESGAPPSAKTVTSPHERPKGHQIISPVKSDKHTLPEHFPASLGERYEDITLVGRGGMGAVYRARDKRLEREVALKFLFGDDPGLSDALLREARSQARLNHENACKVYEVGVVENKAYIVMQYIHGVSLELARERMTLEQKVEILRRIALALHEAHRCGFVHRDIKPSNILLEEAGDGSWKPFITDFGIAREIGQGNKTLKGGIAGTPAFMAPEQARGDLQRIDRRTDVYGLGATLYDLTAGRPPFQSKDPWSIIQQLTLAEAIPLRKINPSLPRDIEAIVMKCLEKEPGRRYESAKALSEDLGRFLNGDPVRAHRLSVGYALVRKARRHKATAALLGVLFVAVIVLVLGWVRTRRLAGAQAVLSRELGEDVKEMELFLRTAYELPLHDIEQEKDVVREKLKGIEARMQAAGQAGEGPGHYALGRGYLALQSPEEALMHLRRAKDAGYRAAELDYAMGLALGDLLTREMEAAKRIENIERRNARIAEIQAEYEEPAKQSLKEALGARLEAPAYAEGLIALYEGKLEEALGKAREAFEQKRWLYEAKKLEGDAYFAEGNRFRVDAEFKFDKMRAAFERAAEAYRAASAIARSDPQIYLVECELWAQMMNASPARKEWFRSSFEQARAACEKAISAGPKSGAARLKQAFVFASRAWWVVSGDSVQDMEKALEEAISRSEDAMRFSPGEPMAHFVAGQTWRTKSLFLGNRGLERREAVGHAIASYEQALRLDPVFLWALNDLGATYPMRGLDEKSFGLDPVGSFESGLRQSRRAQELDPKSLNAFSHEILNHVLLAEYLVESGRDPARSLELARAALEACKRLSGELPWFDYYLANISWIEANHRLNHGEDPEPALEAGLKSAKKQTETAASARARAMMAKLLMTRAEHLARRGENPETVLDEARSALSLVIQANPADLGYSVARARVEIASLRWGRLDAKAKENSLKKAEDVLWPWLDQERVDARLYQAAADVCALRSEALLAHQKKPDAELEKGMSLAEKAPALNPKMAQAFLVMGELLLMKARLAEQDHVRADASRRAEEAFSSALRLQPWLSWEIEMRRRGAQR